VLPFLLSLLPCGDLSPLLLFSLLISLLILAAVGSIYPIDIKPVASFMRHARVQVLFFLSSFLLIMSMVLAG